MVKLISPQTSFTSGEVSFRLKGRVDNDKYMMGLDTAQNVKVLSQGPLVRRNGSFLVGFVKDYLNPPRLLRFIVSVTQSFMLEFGDEYVRFYVDTAAVEDSMNPGQIFELSTPYSLEEVNQLDFSQSEFSLILTHKNHIQQELIFLANAPDAWIFKDFIASPPPTFESGFFPTTSITLSATTGSGVTLISAVPTFGAADVGRSLEILISGGFGIGNIVSFTNNSILIMDVILDFSSTTYNSQEYFLDLSPLTSISFSDVTRTGGLVVVTSPTTFTFIDSLGKYILVHGGVLQVISGDNLEVTCEILKSMSSSDDTANWTLEIPTWGDAVGSAFRGFPSTVTQVQQRLLFAGSIFQPQTIWLSESGIINGFGIGAEDDDSIEIDVVSNEISTIQWMRAARDVVIGTTGGESTINTSSSIITPSNSSITTRSFFKSDRQSPITIGSEVLFIQKGSRKLISYLFDFGTDTFKGEDLTFISEHITESGIKQVAYGQEPNKQLFMVTNNGILISATYDREQSVIAFTKYITQGKYLSVAAIPEGDIDQIWVVVEREINQNVSVLIEVFDESTGEDSADIFSDSAILFSNPLNIESATNVIDALFTSSSHGLIVGDRIKFKQFSQWQDIDEFKFTVTTVPSDDRFTCDYDSSSQPVYEGGARVFKVVTAITGLNHLEGAIVQVKADNALLADTVQKVVEFGEIQLDDEYAEVVVGLSYTSRIVTLPKEFDIGSGSMQAQRKRHIKPVLRVDNSAVPLLNGEIKPSRVPMFNMDAAVPLFSGDLEYSSTNWGTTSQLDIEISDPFPLRLLAIFGTIEGNIK